MFFFSDERCHTKHGKIQLQTEFPFYEPGNTINGVVYLSVDHEVQATHIELDFKGSEKGGFIRHYTETEQHGDETRIVHKQEKLKHSKTFLHTSSQVFSFPGGVIYPGVHQINFQVALPHGIPSSLAFKDKHSREKPKAKVKYYVKAKVLNHKHDMMKYK